MSSAVATTTGAELQDPLLPSSSLKSEKPAPIVANGEKEAPAAKQSCLQQFCGFELRFWICTISCVLCYGVVQAYNYNSATVLLERNYFTPAQDITDCCCWQNGSCYESWPDPQDENSTISWTQYSDCRTGCNFDPSQQPVLNVTTEQMNHIDCNANASLWYGLNQDGWGYDLPALAPNASGTYLKLYCDMSNAADIVAADIAAIPYFVGVVLSPFLGILLDRIGGTALIMTITPAGFAAAHIVLGLFRDVPALVPLLLQGTSYSFFSAALWAPIAHVMPDHMQGVGYGIITAALNFGTAVFPLVVAEIVTLSNNRYLPNTEYLFIGLSTGAFILGVWLCGVDWSRGKELSRSHWNDHGAGETANEDATTGDEEVGIGQGLSDQRSKPKPIVKAGLCMRWPVLIFICLMMVGNFYISELTALQDKLRNEFSDMSSEEFVFEYELLYTIYAFPNIILPFFGGVLVDKFGTRVTLMGFGILITVAQCVFALGCNLHMFWLMLAARALYALGGETITVAQNVILTDWYRGREHAFSFGITLSFCRGGNTLASYVSPLVANAYGVAAALWVGAGICLLCVLCTIPLIILDVRAEKRIVELQRARDAAEN